MPAPAKILIVDDSPANLKALRVRLEAEGYDVVEAADGAAALELASSAEPDLVLLDIVMPGMDGYEVCRRLKAQLGDDFIPVIMVTAKTEPAAIAEGLSAGADDYVAKPFEPVEFSARVQAMLRIRRMYQENTYLKKQIADQHRSDKLIGKSQAMQKLLGVLPKIIDSDVNVLLTGESGTGKEALAQTIHHDGPRRKERFVALNCGALSAGVLESELFGHKKGAFTNAFEDRQGLFEMADGGTLFLDEVSETSQEMQVKLLRALQEREIVRVGESDPRKIDVRIIAATNRDLEAEVKAGRFREDLYYRLCVFPIVLPPLRERRDDIPLLADHFLSQSAKRGNGFEPGAMDALSRYDWPGNVRELANEIERALVLATEGEPIGLDMLSEKLRPTTRSWRREGKLKDIVAEVEKDLIESALELCGGNKSRMAEHLGINRHTLLQKMRRYGVGGEE